MKLYHEIFIFLLAIYVATHATLLTIFVILGAWLLYMKFLLKDGVFDSDSLKYQVPTYFTWCTWLGFIVFNLLIWLKSFDGNLISHFWK